MPATRRLPSAVGCETTRDRPPDRSAELCPIIGAATAQQIRHRATVGASRLTPLVAFGRFEVGRLVRSWKFLAITVGFPVIFYILFLGDHSAGKVVDGTVPWRVYLMVSMCSFGALVAALNAGGTRLSMERASGWARLLRITPIPAWSYVATKVVASMLVVLPVIVLVEAVGAGFGDVRLAPDDMDRTHDPALGYLASVRRTRCVHRLRCGARGCVSSRHRAHVHPRLLRRSVQPD